MASTSSGQASGNGPTDSDPKLEALMEKIRAKGPHQKSWPEIIKGLRMAISDKRHFSEVNDKQLLQKYLDILQKAIKVNGHMSLLEKLSSISRGVGLKYTSSAPYAECFLSTDMFYVEIKVEPKDGRVTDVAVVHDAGERAQCPEVAEIINDGKFDLLTEHLEGLMKVYVINGDKKQKSRCFMALQSLEKDLNCLAQLQNSVHGVSLYIHKTPLGIIQPRIGGLPMKLIFFVAPIDLIKGKSRVPLTVESIMDNNLGHSCTIGIEPSGGHKLQTVPLMSVSKSGDGKSLPSFSALSNQNSCTLPACFTLSLQKPVPVSVATIKRIQAATGIEFGDVTQCKPILPLIVDDFSKGKMTYKPDQPYYMILPNQQHCYYITGNDGDHMTGLMISSLPFVHPTHVPQILQALRQQIAFNTLVGMVVRPEAKGDPETSMIFEMNLVSMTQMSVMFENPVTDTMASVEFDFGDITNIKAQLMSIGGEEPLVKDESLCTIVNKTYSVPITMRCIMKHAGEILSSTQAPTPATPAEQAMTLVPSLPAEIAPVLMEPMITQEEIPPMPTYSQSFVESVPTQNGSIYDYTEPYGSLEPPKGDLLDSIRAEKVAKNPMLASLLDQDNDSNEVQPVLPALLSDSNDKQKQRKHRKRKADARSPGSSSGRSPKRKFSEDDHYRSQEGSFDMDSNDAFDFGQQVPFPSGVAVPSSLQSQTGGGNSSNTPVARRHDPESHVSKLKSSLENIIKQESKPSPRGELVALLTDDDVKQKIPAIGHPTTRRMSVQETPASSGENPVYSAPDPIPNLDPDIFTTDDGAFTPTDFLGGANKEPRSAGFQADALDFNPELLNPDFPDPGNENSEEMDLEACDANAFGMGVNRVAMAAAKIVPESAPNSTAATSTSQTKTDSPQVSTTPPPTKTTPKSSASVVSTSSSLATQVPAPIPSCAAPNITVSEKKEVKKEKKEEFRSEYKPAKKSNERKSLSERIGQPKPDLDALDLMSLPIKENKPTSLKSLLKESLKEKSKDKDESSDDKGEFFTSTSTGGTSLVISAKSSPSGTTKESLKFSVKKDRIKKSSKDDDVKRRKDGSYFSKDKTSKKRKIDEDYKPRSGSKSELKPIKIRTVGGKSEIQPHSSSRSEKKEKPEIPKVTGPDYLKHVLPTGPKPKLPRIPLLSKQGKPNLLDKSTINPQGSKLKKSSSSSSSSISSTSITVSKSDSKLMTGKTPTIKLKPLIIPSQVNSPNSQSVNTKTVTSTTKTMPSTSPSSSKTGSISSPSRQSSTAPSLSGSSTPPLQRDTSTPPTSAGTPPPGAGPLLNLGKGKSPVKSRSLSDVINKLKAKSSGPNSGGEDEDEKDKKKEEKKPEKERKEEKKVIKSEKTVKSTDEAKFKIKPELKKVFSSPVKGSSKQYSSSSSGSSSKSSSSSEKKSEVKKSASSPGSKSEKRSPSPSVKSEKKEKPKEEKEKESSARDPRLEPKTEKRPSSTEIFRQPSGDSPKIRDLKVEEKSEKRVLSPFKESPDSPDDLVIDLPLTPSNASTKTIPMERSSPMPGGKASPVPPSPLVAKVASPLVRAASPLVTGKSSPVTRPASASPRPATTPVPTTAPGTNNAAPAAASAPAADSPRSGPTAAVGPAPAKVPATSPVSNPSPCHIDDDLMNEALMGCADESK